MEQAHHRQWLGPIANRLQQNTPLTQEEFERSGITVDQVLREDPTNALALQIRKQLMDSVQKDNIERALLFSRPTNESVRVTGDMINGIEESLENLERTVCSLFESSNLPEQHQQILLSPFRVAQMNKNNPMKNLELARILAEKNNLSPWQITAYNPDPYQFAYGLMRNDPSGLGQHYAGFARKKRVVLFSEGWDPQDTFDLLYAYHENIHVAHHAEQMKDPETYAPFYAEKKYLISEEYDAYAMMLEILNLVLKNRLRDMAANKQWITEASFIKDVSSKERRPGSLAFITFLASTYFRDGNLEKYPPSFKAAIHKKYEEHDLYVYGPDHKPVPLPR